MVAYEVSTLQVQVQVLLLAPRLFKWNRQRKFLFSLMVFSFKLQRFFLSDFSLIGDQPSGKATAFEVVMTRFDSQISSQYLQCVAQLVAWEPWTLQVAGSSPAALTKFAEIAETDQCYPEKVERMDRYHLSAPNNTIQGVDLVNCQQHIEASYSGVLIMAKWWNGIHDTLRTYCPKGL